MGVAGDWLRGVVYCRVWIGGLVHGLCKAAGFCAVRGVSNYGGNCGFGLGVETRRVGFEIGMCLVGLPCAAPTGLCFPRENGPHRCRSGLRSFVPDGPWETVRFVHSLPMGIERG